MYTRHHGFSLLSHALLGALVLWRNLMDTEFGFISSVVLAAFHGGAVAAFVYTWLQGAIPVSKVIVPHTPFAVWFAAHAYSLS